MLKRLLLVLGVLSLVGGLVWIAFLVGWWSFIGWTMLIALYLVLLLLVGVIIWAVSYWIVHGYIDKEDNP